MTTPKLNDIKTNSSLNLKMDSNMIIRSINLSSKTKPVQVHKNVCFLRSYPLRKTTEKIIYNLSKVQRCKLSEREETREHVMTTTL
jgi:hypothetical protein